MDDVPLTDTKDGGGLDWYTEGPGRRVGYDDLTAIDWIFEYSKERQRLRYLYSQATGLLGQLQQLVDGSQVWIVLLGAGLLAGVLAAAIDIASDWLGDIKTGYCTGGTGGGAFYLNKGFCCWGHEGEIAQSSVDEKLLTKQNGPSARDGLLGAKHCTSNQQLGGI